MEEVLDEILTEIRNTILTKNKCYGNSFHQTIKEYGMIALLICLTDKLNRLKTACRHETVEDTLHETVEDTLLDIAGYAILGLIEIRNMEKNRRRKPNPDVIAPKFETLKEG